jgi:hypothetical protein
LPLVYSKFNSAAPAIARNRRDGLKAGHEVVMSWSLNVGAVAGTAIRIHETFLLLLGWIFGVNYISGRPQAAWSALLFVVLLFLCVLLHEFGHIFTARAFGVRTPDVVLLPIGGASHSNAFRNSRARNSSLPSPCLRSTSSSRCCSYFLPARTFPPTTLPRSRARMSA